MIFLKERVLSIFFDKTLERIQRDLLFQKFPPRFSFETILFEFSQTEFTVTQIRMHTIIWNVVYHLLGKTHLFGIFIILPLQGKDNHHKQEEKVVFIASG